jgi:enoyl-[acyl-carrier protein] reductase II
MIRTELCERLGIQHPVIQAAMGVFGTSAELAAAVSNAGGLGSLGASGRSPDDLRQHLAMTRELTARPFAVNHLVPTLNPESWALTLEARPAAVSLALGDPGDLVKQCHDAGSLVMHQVTTVQQAYQAAQRGVDIIIAQGSESGGFGGVVSALALVPQVVDAVRPIPVVAAGGIYDGRGLSAALALGAQGVNIGTRFIACRESPASAGWKQAIVTAQSEDAVKVEFLDNLMPPGDGNYYAIPRALRTPFIDQWHTGDNERRDRQPLHDAVMAAIPQGAIAELVPFAGQTAGGIRDILPAAEIVQQIVAEAEAVLRRTPGLLA